MGVRYIGVRHHSPACSRLVRHVIRETKPAYVLIEGPADMNERIRELRLSHELPVAIFTYYHGQKRSHASWSPFCDYSPEWVAIQEGARADADVRFMDLPAWHGAFAGVRNRYSDGERRTSLAIRRLCERLSVDGMDALWDHLFEQPIEEAVLETRLAAYFDGLRGDDDAGPRDEPREAYMARCIAWAQRAAGDRDVVVVCGGFHKPALEKLVPTHEVDAWPDLPTPEEGDELRHGSFLVPYSFKRLDSFIGYESGMPSPAYYQHVWDDGPGAAAESMMKAAVLRLRAREQAVSAADLIAARTMAEGLSRLRGHRCLSRTDLLDGIAAALLKDVQEQPLPWTERGRIRPGTDAMLVEVVAALSGERRGKLHPDTPRPPLLEDAKAELSNLDLWPKPDKRSVKLELTSDVGLGKSRALHRLRVLDIPGYVRVKGPSFATDAELDEAWTIEEVFEQESALIEAAAYGATLKSAAAALLEERLATGDGDLDVLTHVLSEATFVGLDALSGRVLTTVAELAGKEGDIARLGRALSRLLSLYRHDTLLGSARSEPMGVAVEAAFDRGLWLVEGIEVEGGGAAPVSDDVLRAVIALRNALKFAGRERGLNGEHAHSVMTRRAVDDDAPPGLRGAALGFTWSLGRFVSPQDAEAHAITALKKAARPETLGDWLAGLFALAREEVLAIEESSQDDEEKSTTLLSVLDQTLIDMNEQDYLVGLPSLRLAFGFFPPLERERIAKRVLSLHGRGEQSARSLLRLPVQAEVVAASLSLEGVVDGIETTHGLTPEEGRVDE